MRLASCSAPGAAEHASAFPPETSERRLGRRSVALTTGEETIGRAERWLRSEGWSAYKFSHSSPLLELSRKVLAELDVHMILEKLGPLRQRTVYRLLLHHSRLHFHLTPIYESWLKLSERWLATLTTKKLQRSAYRNVRELASDIRASLATSNDNPTHSGESRKQVLEGLDRYCIANSQCASPVDDLITFESGELSIPEPVKQTIHRTD